MLPFKIQSDKPLEDFSLEEFLTGCVLLVDKPLEWTSFQVVNKLKYFVRNKFNLKKFKIGHAGTLDPLATGLLIICTGKKTKIIGTFQGQDKEYTGTITLGATTPSYDLETEVDQEFPTDSITKEQIQACAQTFLGEITQVPPIFSALKVDGKRAYKAARKGEEVKMKSRQVHIREFEVNSENFPHITFRIVCSKGTYIRSIAKDFGDALNNGAHLSALRRTKIGDHTV
ncbi:MAG: tRNA pseudouridine55 synthase [Saprospiraceae bacterium]|jgi:tRNA pseudouridine55 synthase